MDKNQSNLKIFFSILVIAAVFGVLGFKVINDNAIPSGKEEVGTFLNLFSKKPPSPPLNCWLIHPGNETYPESDVVWLTKVAFDGKPGKRPLTRIKLDGEEVREKTDKKNVLRDLVIESRKRTDGGTTLLLGMSANARYFSDGPHNLEVDVRDSKNRSCTAKANFRTTREKGQVLSSADEAISIIQKAQAEEELPKTIAQQTKTQVLTGKQATSKQGINLYAPIAAYFPYFADSTNGWYPAVKKMADSPNWITDINDKLNQYGVFSTHGLSTPLFSLKYQTLQPEPVPFGLISNNGFALLYDTNGNYWGIAYAENVSYKNLFGETTDVTTGFAKFAASLKANHPNELVAIFVDDIIDVSAVTVGGIEQKCVDATRAISYPDLGVIVVATFDNTIQLSFTNCRVNANNPMGNSTFGYMGSATLHEAAHIFGLDDVYLTGYPYPNLMGDLSMALTRDQAANFALHTWSDPVQGLDGSVEALDFYLDYGRPPGTNPSYNSKSAAYNCGNGLLGLSGYSSTDWETCEIEYLDGDHAANFGGWGWGPFGTYFIYDSNNNPLYAKKSFGTPVTSSGLPSHTMDWSKPTELCFFKDPATGNYCQRLPQVWNGSVESGAGGGFDSKLNRGIGVEYCESALDSCSPQTPYSWNECLNQPQGGGSGYNNPPPNHNNTNFPGGSLVTPYSALGSCFDHCGDGILEKQYGEQCDYFSKNPGGGWYSQGCSIGFGCDLDGKGNNDCRCVPLPGGVPTYTPPQTSVSEPVGYCGDGITVYPEECEKPGDTCKYFPPDGEGGLGLLSVCDAQCKCPPVTIEPPPVQ